MEIEKQSTRSSEPISNRFSLNKAEKFRSLRDVIIVLFGMFAERALNYALAYDLGEYQFYVTAGASVLAIVLNRYVNWLRVDSNGNII